MARPRRSQDTREKLLDEGVKAFLATGYHGTGIKEILDAVNVPKGSFYNYFESKEAFGAATIAHYAECLANKLEDARKGGPTALAGLRNFFEDEMASYEASGFVGGCLVANLGAEFEGSPVFRRALQSAVRGYHASVADALAAAQHDGAVRADIPAADLAAILIDAWEGAVIRMKIEHNLAPLRSCITRMLDGFLKP